jgi:hypothetical protein
LLGQLGAYYCDTCCHINYIIHHYTIDKNSLSDVSFYSVLDTVLIGQWLLTVVHKLKTVQSFKAAMSELMPYMEGMAHDCKEWIEVGG